ncbi:UNVERIFIED_CONTAM: DMP19 family protein [Prevotella sp. 15_C9]
MLEIKVKESLLRNAAEEGMDAFVGIFIDSINSAVNGVLTPENMEKLFSDQITLLGWSYLHDEVMEGGYIQLIYNGYGAFIFENPFARVLREWGLKKLYSHIQHARKAYEKYHERIEVEMTDDEFMALYEQMPQFDESDDEFVLNEEEWTQMIAEYIDEHISNFVIVEKNE